MLRCQQDEYYNLFFGKAYGFFKILTNPIFLAIVGVILLTLSTINYGMTRDEGMWSYMARAWAENDLIPYTESVDNKPPGIFLLFYLSHVLFGINFWFPRLVGIFASTVISLCLYLLIRRLADHISGVVGMVLYICVVPTKHFEGAFIAHTETFMVLGIVIAFLLVVMSCKWDGHRSYLGFCGAGAAAGFAITFKQVAIFDCLALLVLTVPLLKTRTKSGCELAKILMGMLFFAVTVNILSVIPILLSGGPLNDYLNMAWVGLLHGRETSISLTERLENIPPAWKHNFMIVPLLGAIGFILHRKRLRDIGLPVGVLLIWFVLEFVGVNAAGTYYGHQYRQILPSLCVMYGIFFGFLAANLGVKGQSQSFFKTSKKIALGVILATMIYYIPFNDSYGDAFKVMVRGQNEPYRDLGLYMRRISRKDQYIYLFGKGQDQVLSYSGRLAPSPYFNELFLSYPGALERVKRDIINKNTTFILLGQNGHDNKDLPTWLQKIADTYYTVSERRDDYKIFNLKKQFEK